MKKSILFLLVISLVLPLHAEQKAQSVLLEELTWIEAEKALESLLFDLFKKRLK